jgi:hypothetical protein
MFCGVGRPGAMARPAAAELDRNRTAVVCPRGLLDRDLLPHRQNHAERYQRQLAVEQNRAIDRCQPAKLFDDALGLRQECVAEKPANAGCGVLRQRRRISVRRSSALEADGSLSCHGSMRQAAQQRRQGRIERHPVGRRFSDRGRSSALMIRILRSRARDLAHQEIYRVEIVRNDRVIHIGAVRDRRERTVRVRRMLAMAGRENGAALVFDHELATAANGKTAGFRGDDLDERIRTGVQSFARQPGDAKPPIVEHRDRRIDPPVGAGDRELHELTSGKRAGRGETQNLPAIEKQWRGRGAFAHHEVNRTAAEEHHGDGVVLPFVRLQPRKEDRREQL